MAREMLLGTQHHTQMVRPPLSGADMGSAGWGSEGTYLSGGGFVRQSQDSHRQYIFEWSGARSVEEASYMQALRDGVYSKSRRDLIYFIDPNIYDKNILPKRWAQPGILAPDSGSAITPLGVVSKVDGPGISGLPLTGAQVSSHFTSLAQFNATTEPQQGSIWVPVPPGKTLHVVAWTGNPVNSESGVYVRGQNLDGTWNPASLVEGIGFIGSGLRGVLIGTVGVFDFYAARAVLDLSPSQRPVTYAWTGTPNESASTRTDDSGTVTNLFTNPDMQATSGEVVVWENRIDNAGFSSTSSWVVGSRMGSLEQSTEHAYIGHYSGKNTTGVTGGTGTAYALRSQTVGVEEGVWVGMTVFVLKGAGGPMWARPSFRLVDGEGNYVTNVYGDWVEVDSEWAELRLTYEVSAGVSGVEFSVYTSATDSAGVPLDAGIELFTNGWMGSIASSEESVLALIADPFNETYSPDPDLTPQPRPGGGSQLVGVSPADVGNNAATRRAVISEETVSPAGTNSMKLIVPEYNSSTTPYGVRFTGSSEGLSEKDITVIAWCYIPEGYDDSEDENYANDNRIARTLYAYTGGTGSLDNGYAQAPSTPGWHLVRAHISLPEDVGDDAIRVTPSYKVGQPIYWGKITVVDDPNYQGEPFSGDTPDNLPEWSPGLGHSGCAFVGNPTWTATSGVNGGQVGYAATLKEVGDWQQ